MPTDLWQKTRHRIRSSLDEHTYRSWFEPTQFHSYDSGELTVAVPNEFYARWLTTHYMDLIAGMVEQIDPDCDQIVFTSSQDGAGVPRLQPKRESPSTIGPQAGPRAQRIAHGRLNPKYTFDNFVVGESNRFAQAAALAVAESPGRAYNPLFLYSGVGLGKTHLMHAIGHEMMRRNPNLCNVTYVSSELFTNELIDAIMNKSTQAFRNKYRSMDILLIDDIHFIAGKDSTQDEFFHTFNALHNSHRQVVLSSDRQPKDIPLLEERLISRFQWGLVTDIQAPDIETRIAILQKKAAQEGLANTPREVFHFIATLITANIRELEGALIRVRAYASLVGKPITLALVEEALKVLIGQAQSRQITAESVQKTVAKHYDLRMADLKGRNRQRAVAFPRQIAMYLCRKLVPGIALKAIGEAFGGKDHTTVIHACKRIDREMTANRALVSVLDHLESEVRKS